ncbi:MaoC/PaaZ C-terminal domain-containing protein [Brooklawnia sp.]|uniref:MaoC/PaaZ C-terminal domain-containing protein n=1 Tax=Brooklawnia sp. TaxID=2699740 RepID=UPI00311EC0E2
MTAIDLAAVAVGDQLPPLELHLTRPDVVRYSGASTDFNPIHYSDRVAKAIGLPGVVVHGMWTMGAALRIVTDWVGDPARVASYFVRFVNPVPVPDDDEGTAVQVQAHVTAVSDGVATIALEATHDGDKVLGAAKATVRLD